MASPQFVQTPVTYPGPVSQAPPFTLTLPNVTPGSVLLFVGFSQTGNRTYFIETDVGDDVLVWAHPVITTNSNRVLVAGVVRNAIGGNTVFQPSAITLDFSLASAIAYEIEPCFLELWGSYRGPSGATGYTAKPSGLDVSADSSIIAIGGHLNFNKNPAPVAPYTTDLISDDERLIAMHRLDTPALTGERPSWTHDNDPSGGMTFVFRAGEGVGGVPSPSMLHPF